MLVTNYELLLLKKLSNTSTAYCHSLYRTTCGPRICAGVFRVRNSVAHDVIAAFFTNSMHWTLITIVENARARARRGRSRHTAAAADDTHARGQGDRVAKNAVTPLNASHNNHKTTTVSEKKPVLTERVREYRP